MQGHAVANSAPRERTLNERLNDISLSLQSQCERIESVLCRINGTPQTQGQPARGLADVAKINPTLPLATVVEHLEAVQSRLTELAMHVERVA